MLQAVPMLALESSLALPWHWVLPLLPPLLLWEDAPLLLGAMPTLSPPPPPWVKRGAGRARACV